MDFQQGDIITKNDTVWISQRLLVDVSDVSESYLWKKARPSYKSSVPASYHRHATMPYVEDRSWRYARMKGTFYYDLSTIPNRKPTYYRNYFGDADTLVADYKSHIANKASNSFEREFKDYVNRIYNEYLYCPAYQEATKVQRTGLAKACAAFEFAVQYCEDHPEFTRRKVAKKVGRLVNRYDMSYIPGSTKRLLEKINELYDTDAAIVELIYLPRTHNDHAKIDIPDVVTAWSMKLRSMGQNYTNEFIIRHVQELCVRYEYPKPSRRWFGINIFEKTKTKFLVANRRYGEGTPLAARYNGYTPMAEPLFAGDSWMMDATRLNILPHEFVDKNGKKRKKHLFMFAVRDTYSGDLLGYHFDYKEDRYAWINTLKAAVAHTGYLPYELVTDRFPGHNTQEWKRVFEAMKRLGVKVSISHNPQAKAKLERAWGTIQTVIEAKSEYFYGEGIRSKRNFAHRSPEYLVAMEKKCKREGWDLGGAYGEGTEIIEAYRHTPLKYYSRKYPKEERTPYQMHRMSEKPNIHTVSDAQISMLFDPKKRVTLKNMGQIVTQFYNENHIYRVDNYEILSSVDRVIMSYDINDLRKTYLWQPKEDLLVFLCEAQEFEAPQVYGPQAEYGKIQSDKARIKQLNELRKAELEEVTAEACEVDLMMGIHTIKEAKNASEDAYLDDYIAAYGHDTAVAVGQDYQEDEEDDDDWRRNALRQL